MDTPGVDMATFRPVQCCYTAAPRPDDGVADPVPDRLVVIPGEPLVTIRPIPPSHPREGRAQAGPSTTPPPPSGRRSDAYRDAALAGIKGALLRTTEGQRHHALVVAATRMFELRSLSDDYVERVNREAAEALNQRGSRVINPEEVDEALEWARHHTASGRAAA